MNRILTQKFAEILMDEDDGKDEISGDIMPRINGVSYRCKCGCNVFRYITNSPSGEKRMKCNSCQARFIVE